MNSPERYLEELLARILVDCQEAAETGSAEAIHELRVGIKRLRAGLRLAEWLNPRYSAAPRFRPFRRLSKAAANPRDLDVRMETVRRLSGELNLDLSEYYNHLKVRERRSRAHFRAFAAGFPREKFRGLRKRLRRALDRIGEDYIRYRTERFFEEQFRVLATMADRRDLSSRDLHRIRILAKEVRYVGEILACGESPSTTYQEADPPLKRLHQALGCWHDAQISKERVERFLRRQKPQKLYDRGSYDRFAARLAHEAEQGLANFRSEWGRFRESVRSGIGTTREKSRTAASRA
jgi:CHAD domain-containing protein